MNETFIVNSAETAAKAQAAINSLIVGIPHEVVIRPKKENRSAAQNALYWMWMTEIAKATGESKEEVHARCKQKFLARIYERDDPEGYGQMIAAVREVHKVGLKIQAKTLAAEIVRLTSTTDATVKQLTEYLEDIERFHAEKGIYLPHPEDRYQEAMGHVS